MHDSLGFILALFVGISLGLIGSGGSILSVPILVYILHIEPFLATSYSLFTVGFTALIGSVQKVNQKLVDFKKVFLFGIPSVFSVFVTRFFIVTKIPKIIYLGNNVSISKSIAVLLFFAIVMIFAALKMIRPFKQEIIHDALKINYLKIISTGLLIGLVSGIVGAGGGFLIIPALIILLKTPTKTAIGTSLFIVAIQSLIGFLGDFSSFNVFNWSLLFKFTSTAVLGLFIGNYLAKKISGENLKVFFGYFVMSVAVFIILKELLIEVV